MSPQPLPGFAARRLDEFILAMTLLTRIPMPPAHAGDSAALGRAVWAYPLVGALIGAIGAGVFSVSRWLDVPPLPSAVLATAVMILATGCFHEDGLADFWDGIGGGRTIERKLEIMRDSRIGSYGAAAMGLALLFRVSAVSGLDERGLGAVALILSGLMGRSALAGVLALLPPARGDGLAATAAAPPPAAITAALAWSLLAFALVPSSSAVLAFALAVLATACMIRLMRRQIDGYTGDGLGATEQTVEVAVLTALLVRLPH
jgi:adenosylcobinamide-GDP ribazoletransferase